MKFQLLNVALAACLTLASALPVSDTDSPLQKRAVTISNEGSIPKQAQCGAKIKYSKKEIIAALQKGGDATKAGTTVGDRYPFPIKDPGNLPGLPFTPPSPPSPPPVPEIPDIPEIPTPPGVPGFRRSLPDDDDEAGDDDSLPGLAARNSKALQHFPMKNGKSAYNGGKVKDERVMYWMDKGDDSLEYAGLWTHEGAPAKGQFVKCTETF